MTNNTRRSIDWKLSATPTRRGVRVFLVAALIPAGLLASCALTLWIYITIVNGPPTPKRSLTALDFFPPASAYPADYEVVEAPGYAGEYSPASIGDEDDGYALYKPEREASGWVQIFVYYQSHWNPALNRYEFSLAFLTGYKPVKEISFQSARAQEWTIVCEDGRPTDGSLWCAYVARYDEFVIDLRAAVGPNYLSVAEFESLMQAIDRRAIELLGPTPAPMP